MTLTNETTNYSCSEHTNTFLTFFITI